MDKVPTILLLYLPQMAHHRQQQCMAGTCSIRYRACECPTYTNTNFRPEMLGIQMTIRCLHNMFQNQTNAPSAVLTQTARTHNHTTSSMSHVFRFAFPLRMFFTTACRYDTTPGRSTRNVLASLLPRCEMIFLAFDLDLFVFHFSITVLQYRVK